MKQILKQILNEINDDNSLNLDNVDWNALKEAVKDEGVNENSDYEDIKDVVVDLFDNSVGYEEFGIVANINLVARTSFPPVDPTLDLEEFFKTIRPPNEHKSKPEPVVNKTYKPKTITLPAEIVELVMNNCNDGEPPQNKEEWNELIAEIVEEYFNY